MSEPSFSSGRRQQHIPIETLSGVVDPQDLDSMQRVLSAAANRPDLIPQTFLAYLIDFIQTSGIQFGQAQISGDSVIVIRKLTSKTVVSTTTATDLLNGEVTIGGGVMGGSKLLRLTAWGDYKQNSGATSNALRFQLVFGATTIFDTGAPAFTLQNLATRFGWSLEAYILNAGTAAAQDCYFRLELNGQTASAQAALTTGEGRYATIPVASSSKALASGYNSASEDTSSSKALALKVINPSANAACETVLKGALVEIF